MAKVPFTIPDDQVSRFVDGSAGAYNYQAVDAEGTPNPETKAQYAKRKIRAYIVGVVLGYEAGQAADAARTIALANSLTVEDG